MTSVLGRRSVGDMPKTPRPGSIMGDDERAMQPRPASYAPKSVMVSGELEVPEFIERDNTPPPIVIDDIGRPISSGATPTYNNKQRPRMTAQELAEALWPARKIHDLVLEQAQKLAAAEAQIEALQSNGPAAVAAAQVAALRAELVGADGEGGIVGALTATVARDLKDHRDAMKEVDARATRSDKFVRRFLYAAGSLVAGSLIGAVALIYAAGQHSVRNEVHLEEIRVQLRHRAESLDEDLTDLKAQVKLLLETQLGKPR